MSFGPIPENGTLPAITIVMPVYNAESVLATTIASVQSQSHQIWELIAVDDGSSDGSARILATHAAADRRIRVVSQHNSGVSAARNRGVAESQAPLIAFLDADDLWHPSKLVKHLDFHRQNPSVGVSFARVEFLSPAGSPTGVLSARRRDPLVAQELLAENPTTTTSNWVVRRQVFDQVGGFVVGMNHSEDLEWLLRVACCSSWILAPLPDVLTYYRTSAGGLSSGLARMESGWHRLVEEARHYAPSLVRRHHARAQAIQLRYLARRALRLRCPSQVGFDYLGRALRSDWTLVFRQPRRTLLTAAALAGQAILQPPSMSQSPSPLPALAETPLVSVVMPLYNAAATVGQSLESVLSQTYRKLEIIVVDDGSTDAGVEICRSYQDPRIRIVHQRNRGLAGARNTGIRHAHGEIIAFLDSDDLWTPHKIEQHVRHFQRNPLVGVSFSRSELIDRDGHSLGIFQTPKLRRITPADVLCRNPISNGSCVVIRREVLDGIRFQDNLYGETEDFWFDDSFRQSEDIECWIRIAVQSPYLIEGVPEPLTLYRVNSGGLSADVEKQYASWCRVIEKAGSFAPALVARHGRRARAYQLRYLARRAIRERQPRLGVRLLHRALRTHPCLLVEEPARTVISLVAGYVGLLLPPVWYERLERMMMGLVGRLQRLRFGAGSRASGGR